ncbi:MAG: trimethylamine methyltransferase family protein [Acidobacteriota bacterium]
MTPEPFLLKVVNKTTLESIHEQSLALLSKAGVVFDNEEIVRRFRENGQKADGKRVYLSEAFVMQALENAPQDFTMTGRDNAAEVIIGKRQNTLVVAPGNGTLFIQDIAGKRRRATIADFDNITRLCEQSRNVSLVGAIPVDPVDVAEKSKPAKLVHRLMQYSNKPLIGQAATLAEVRQSFDIIEIAFGQKGFLDHHVAIGYGVNPASPLVFESLACETVQGYAERRQAIFILPGLMPGLTGPMDFKGLVILSNAENLAGITCAQMLNPGTPVVYSAGTFMVNMKNFYAVTGSPQATLVNIAGIQMAREYYDLPSRTMAGLTDAKEVDFQAGAETMQNLALYTMAGVHMINECLGVMDSVTTTSFEKWVPGDNEGFLWVGTEDGLCRFEEQSARFSRYVTEPMLGRVRVLSPARGGGLWVGTEEGVFRLHPRQEGDEVRGSGRELVPGTLGMTCTALLEDGENRLWIGTKAHGLLCFDQQTGVTVVFEHRVSDPFSLSHNDVRALLIDRNENLWVGTRGGGVNKLDLKPRKFPRALSGQGGFFRESVRAFEIDDRENLWVGTSGGLHRFGSRSGEVESFTFDPKNEASLSYQQVRAVLQDSVGRLWIGTNGGGLNLYDPNSGGFVRFRNRPGDRDSLGSDNVLALSEASGGGLWIGTDGGGLDYLEPKDGTFRHYSNDPADPASLSDDAVTALLEDRAGDLWIGTAGGGLNRMKSDGSGFRRYRQVKEGSFGLSNDNILCLHEAGDGVLWIGTHAGLNALDRLSETIEILSERDGLPSNVIYGILEDDEGILWLTTNQGLARLDPATRECRTYGTDDGLQSLGFNEGAAYRGDDGTMYIGGINGFNLFSPMEVHDNPFVPEVLITGLSILNRKHEFARGFWSLEDVDLLWSDTTFTFDFAGLEFTAPEKNNYRYRMEGFDREWIQVGHRRHATYTNLGPGDYVFRVQASNNDGMWSPEGASIRVRVLPAVWQTWWFRAAAGLAFLILLAGAYRLRTRAIRRRNEDLEGLVERREQAEAEVRRYAEELEHSTLHDRLTGLPNRALFLDRLQVVMDRTRRDENLDFAVMVLDLDGFKLVNDSLGHVIGDELLSAITQRAESKLRSGDSLARLGADEFALLLSNVGDITALRRLLERMHRALDDPFKIRGHEIFSSVSIGVVVNSDSYRSPGEMLRDADTAMHRAKAAGRGTHVIFNPEMHVEASFALEMEGALRRAIDRDQFVLEYQPIVDIGNGRLVGFEALLRWRRPGHGVVFPGEFLSHARNGGFSIGIGDWVVRQACEQAGLWQKVSTNGPVSVSVNLFSQQVSDERLVDLVRDSLGEASLDPGLLHLEITEDVLIDAPDSAISVLSELRNEGLRVLLDDFGTGYSSLTYLQRFPIDGLKIDRSFVSGMMAKPESAKIVESIILLAKSLDKDVIAEGVETGDTMMKLRDLGCRFSQGFFFGRSLGGEAATLLVEQARTWPFDEV